MRQVYSDDPTARGDQIAEEMRAHYEANRETWWDRFPLNPRRKMWQLTSDNLMLGLLAVVERAQRDCERQDAERDATAFASGNKQP